MPRTHKWVYFFGNGKAEGRGDQKELLGGKGAGLAEMTRIGLPVPAGFTITTEACAFYHEHRGKWPPGLEKQFREALKKLERICKKKIGDPKDPLLVSVRSGAVQSMPGMMETVLNLGLNDESVEGLARLTDNRRFALDAYRRLITMYGSVVKGIAREHFEEVFDRIKETRTRARLGLPPERKVQDTDVDADELEQFLADLKAIYYEQVGEPFPQDPAVQLKGAINAVFESWMAPKAVTYRRVERITDLTGTAVTVCRMVFGNIGEDSGTGVCFTRDPNTGAPVLFGDLLINAQGEDVVSGARTPVSLDDLSTLMPDVYDELMAVRAVLEIHYKEMQDLEFTIERGRLYMLQCRSGKRSPNAAFRIAVDQATKGLLSRRDANRLARKGLLSKKSTAAATRPVITRDEAILRITAPDVERLFYPVLDPSMDEEGLGKRWLGEGLGAAGGAACGQIVFTAADAEARGTQGGSVILVRRETSPEDVGGMHAAAGILTARGGKTSHAAVVARGWGKCCVVGCDELSIDYRANRLTLNGHSVSAGDWITLDARTGRIFDGKIDLVRPDAPPEFETLMRWCDQRRRLKVRANADTPIDALKALEYGAEGIGLCRTEHMFFDSSQPRRINAMREMILARDGADRAAALRKLVPFQREDFEGIFAAMHGKPVTIRLLDPPLHEFLPERDNPQGQQAVADELNANIEEEKAQLPDWDHDARTALDCKRVSAEDIARLVDQLQESNPMLGHRGCRLYVTYPQILDMQVRAIMEAAVACTARGTRVLPEIMIPYTIEPAELELLITRARRVADAVLKEAGAKLKYLVGTMIETPRAALLAERMAAAADFFSYGTNDLTMLAMALSRDDAGRFLPDYLGDPDAPTEVRSTRTEAEQPASAAQSHDGVRRAPLLSFDPFQTLDVEGVGLLVQMGVEAGRAAKPQLKQGICGEHAADPETIGFCEAIGLDYVSCSTFRVPVARLAAARAAIRKPSARSRITMTGAKQRNKVTSSKRGPKTARKRKKRPARKR